MALSVLWSIYKLTVDSKLQYLNSPIAEVAAEQWCKTYSAKRKELGSRKSTYPHPKSIIYFHAQWPEPKPGFDVDLRINYLRHSRPEYRG